MRADQMPRPWSRSEERMMPNGNPAPEVEHLSMTRVKHLIGKGVESDPLRIVQSYYLDGAHVFTVDPSEPQA